MVDEKILLSQCVGLANQIIKKDMKATISIQIFKFENTEVENERKKKSPSQEKRDLKRTLNFKEKLVKYEEKGEVKEEFRIKEENVDINH